MKRVLCVIDSRGWVQERRMEHLRRALPELELETVTPKRWLKARERGDERPVYFGSWRTLRSIERERGAPLKGEELGRSMASVTSHYEIGGGLDPARALAEGSDPDTAFAEAIDTLRRFDVVTSNSAGLHALLLPRLPHVLCLPNGVDTEVFRPARDERAKGPLRIGWAGKTKSAKGVELLDEVLERLREREFETRPMRVGKSTSRFRLRSPTRMARYYQGLDAYVCTSWHEGTPNPALEAAACGVPVVSTPVGNMPELIEHGLNGWLVEPNADAFVAAFDEFAALSEADRAAVGQAARVRITRSWSWPLRASAYAEAFAVLLSKPPSTAIAS